MIKLQHGLFQWVIYNKTTLKIVLQHTIKIIEIQYNVSTTASLETEFTGH